MEDYKEKYAKALAKAKKLYEEGTITESLVFVFPELAESEDEKIRKDIISFLRSKNGYMNPDEDWDFHNRWLPWLEKQKDHEAELDKAYKTADEVMYRRGYEDAKRELEMQSEKKSDICDGCNNIKGCVTCTNGDQWAHYSEIDDSKQELSQSVAKTSEQWSEDDERICRAIICDIANDKAICKYELSKAICDEQINWLKSLKERLKGE